MAVEEWKGDKENILSFTLGLLQQQAREKERREKAKEEKPPKKGHEDSKKN